MSSQQPKMEHFQKILGPVITEKASLGGEIVIKVDRTMSKPEIREAVERIFSVKVASVRTLNQQGKMKAAHGSIGRRKSFKKAYVKLVEGETIDLIEGL